MSGVMTRATGLDGGWWICGLGWSTICCRTSIGTKIHSPLPRKLNDENCWLPSKASQPAVELADRGPLWDMFFEDLMNDLVAFERCPWEFVWWVSADSGEHWTCNKWWACSYTWCGNLKLIGFLCSITPKEPSLPSGSKTDKPMADLHVQSQW